MIHLLVAWFLLMVVSVVAARLTVLAWPGIRLVLRAAVVLAGVCLVAWLLTH